MQTDAEYQYDRKWSYAFQLLFQELERERKDKEFHENYFAEKGGISSYNKYCGALSRIEDLEAALIQLGGKPYL
jgi:hypothetical protein